MALTIQVESNSKVLEALMRKLGQVTGTDKPPVIGAPPDTIPVPQREVSSTELFIPPPPPVQSVTGSDDATTMPPVEVKDTVSKTQPNVYPNPVADVIQESKARELRLRDQITKAELDRQALSDTPLSNKADPSKAIDKKPDPWWLNAIKGSLIGLGQADPREDIWTMLGRAAGGAGGNAVIGTMDEQMQKDSRMNQSDVNLARLNKTLESEIKNQQAQAEIGQKIGDMKAKIEKGLLDRDTVMLEAMQKNASEMKDVWKALPDFDPDSNEKDKEFSERYKRASGGGILPKKISEKKIQTSGKGEVIAVDPRLGISNPVIDEATGEPTISIPPSILTAEETTRRNRETLKSQERQKELDRQAREKAAKIAREDVKRNGWEKTVVTYVNRWVEKQLSEKLKDVSDPEQQAEIRRQIEAQIPEVRAIYERTVPKD